MNNKTIIVTHQKILLLNLMQNKCRLIYHDFKVSLLGEGNSSYLNADNDVMFQQRFETWHKLMGVRKFEQDFPDATLIWVFPRVKKPHSPTKIHARREAVLIVAIDKETDAIRIIESKDRKFFQGEILLKHVEEALQDRNVHHHYNFEAIHNFLERSEIQPVVHVSLKGQKRKEQDKRNRLNNLAASSAEPYMREEWSAALAEIESMIDRPAMNFVSAHKEKIKEGGTPLDIYNFIVGVPDFKIRQYRLDAFSALMPASNFFIGKNSFWDKIDQGVPVFHALASYLNCKPSTLKNMMTIADALSAFDCVVHQGRLLKLSQYFDRIDYDHWPKTRAQMKFFQNVLQIADSYAGTFEKDIHSVINRWLRDHKTWERLFLHKTRSEIEYVLDHNNRRAAPPMSDLTRRNDKLPMPAALASFLAQVASRYRNNNKSIADMKNDVEKRLLVPTALLALEKSHPDIDSIDLKNGASEINGRLSQVMWKKAKPSDLIAASSYWHSPRVNFRARFNSLATGKDAVWQNFLKDPLPIGNGTVIHPLASYNALAEEAEAMKHCVWSYSNDCINHGYHIFSIRNKEGKRFSTLSVVESLGPNGRRTVYLNQNKGLLNANASASAVQAGRFLIAGINDGTIPADWEGSDRSKAHLVRKSFESKIGYDFRDPVQRENILALYRPCLPRAIAHYADTFNNLVKALNVDEIVSRYLVERGISPVIPARTP